MVGHVFVNRDKSHTALFTTANWLTAIPPEWSQQSFTYWYLGSMALYQYDGPHGPLWKQWNENLKNTLMRSQQREGHWPGATASETAVQTSLGTLCYEIYFRHPNVFGTAK